MFNLFDTNQKYATVVSSKEMIDYTLGLSEDLFPEWTEAQMASVV